MPWFRFIEDARRKLSFRDGVCELTFANLPGEDCWAWVAERKEQPSKHVVLLRRPNVMALSDALVRTGFAVESGSAAEKIMRAAERCGYAEELPDDERWRDELLKARRAALPFTNTRERR